MGLATVAPSGSRGPSAVSFATEETYVFREFFYFSRKTLVQDRQRERAADPRCAPPRDLQRGARTRSDRRMARAGKLRPMGAGDHGREARRAGLSLWPD